MAESSLLIPTLECCRTCLQRPRMHCCAHCIAICHCSSFQKVFQENKQAYPLPNQPVMASSSEEVLVLYGSQTGNSEAAAEQLSSLLPSKLSTSDNRTLTSRCMHLDDFLELEQAKWTRLVIIVCSSYGVGQAPIGARKFREVCDTILERFGYDDIANDNNKNKSDKMLAGVNYALLGLGDSHYTTFFRNPTTFENALSTAGATRVGELGKADASGTGNMEQSKVIERWIDAIWKDLQPVIDKPMTEEEGLKLKKAHEQTWKLCLELYKEWKQTNYFALIGLFLPLGGVILGILIHLYLHGYTWGN